MPAKARPQIHLKDLTTLHKWRPWCPLLQNPSYAMDINVRLGICEQFLSAFIVRPSVTSVNIGVSFYSAPRLEPPRTLWETSIGNGECIEIGPRFSHPSLRQWVSTAAAERRSVLISTAMDAAASSAEIRLQRADDDCLVAFRCLSRRFCRHCLLGRFPRSRR